MKAETRVPIRTDTDILKARHQVKALAEAMGFSGADLTVIATAISEVARNILVYAHDGEVILSPIEQGPRSGLQVVAHDQGPGIANLTLAMQDGYSTSNSLGLGLPGARRLMDEFQIDSASGKGTTVIMKKWKH